MELKKVWMSPDTKKKSKYGYRAVGGILGIVLLMASLAQHGASAPVPNEAGRLFHIFGGVYLHP